MNAHLNSISGASEKRIMVSYVPGLKVYHDPYFCAPILQAPMFLRYYPQEKLPLYLATATINVELLNGAVEDYCVDCRLLKGSTDQKPDFW